MNEAEPTAHPLLGMLNLLVGALLLGAIWVALPTRWWPVDLLGSLLGALLLMAGAGLLARRRWGRVFALWISGLFLSVGLLVTGTLAMTVGELSALYGPVGLGGALILGVVFVALVPYIVVFPAAALFFLAGSDESRAPQAVDG